MKNIGKTILIVLHELNLAYHFCDHVVLMRDDQALDRGAPLQILTEQNIKTAFDIEGHAYLDAEGSCRFDMRV